MLVLAQGDGEMGKNLCHPPQSRSQRKDFSLFNFPIYVSIPSRREEEVDASGLILLLIQQSIQSIRV
jgi:hypothetical protein